jgi:signal transduction histidine kinase
MGRPEPSDLPLRRDGIQSADVRGIADELRAVTRQLEVRTRQLERSEARFRDVIERHADALVVVDRAGTIRFANRVAAELFGHPPEELVGSMFGFPVVAGETTELDLLVRGAARVAEMRVVLSEWEGTEAFIASLRDVTERKVAEQAARRLIREQAGRVAAEESARRLEFLLDTTTVLTASLDYDATLSSLARLCVQKIADWTIIYGVEAGRPRRLNVVHRDPSKAGFAEELRALPIDSERDHPVLDVLRSRRARLVRDVSEKTLRDMSTNARELELVRELGVSSFMLVPMVARDRVLGAIAFVCSRPDRPFEESDLALAEDIARRASLAMDSALLYRQAHEANQSKANFLAVVSHDLRTPLTAILGYSELLELGVPDPISDANREKVSRIRTSAKHLLYLLNELLAFARLEAGREELRPQDVDVCTIAREVGAVMEPLAGERELALFVDIPEQPLTLRTDADKLRQVLLNLVGNAVKYTERGEVRLILGSPRERELEIRVRDTGRGIAETHLQQIFEPFWQVDPSQRSQGGGTGLGLSVVKHLVELLDGTIAVESRPDEGSVFTVMFRER